MKRKARGYSYQTGRDIVDGIDRQNKLRKWERIIERALYFVGGFLLAVIIELVF